MWYGFFVINVSQSSKWVCWSWLGGWVGGICLWRWGSSAFLLQQLYLFTTTQAWQFLVGFFMALCTLGRTTGWTRTMRDETPIHHYVWHHSWYLMELLFTYDVLRIPLLTGSSSLFEMTWIIFSEEWSSFCFCQHWWTYNNLRRRPFSEHRFIFRLYFAEFWLSVEFTFLPVVSVVKICQYRILVQKLT